MIFLRIGTIIASLFAVAFSLSFVQNTTNSTQAISKTGRTFLDPRLYEIDGFDLSTYSIEYQMLKQINNGKNELIIERQFSELEQSKPSCWSIVLNDYVDLNEETETRLLRIEFLKLNGTAVTAIGVESDDANSNIFRVFALQRGEIAVVNRKDFYVNKNTLKYRFYNIIDSTQDFAFEEGEIVEVYYFAPDQSILLVNINTNNMLVLPANTVSQLGRYIKIFIGLSSTGDTIRITSP